MRLLPRLAFIAVLLSTAMPALAVKVEGVEVRGLDEAMTENVRVNLSLEDAIGKVVTGRRMAYLVRVAEDEAREALEPFGYYSPTITIQRSDRDAPQPSRDAERSAEDPAPRNARDARLSAGAWRASSHGSSPLKKHSASGR